MQPYIKKAVEPWIWIITQNIIIKNGKKSNYQGETETL